MPRNSFMRNSGYPKDPLQWLVEPPWCVELFLDEESFEGEVLDPCCGGGTIVSALLARGINARGSDIEDRGFGEVRDFLSITEPVDNIMVNFPYKHVTEFTRHALTLARCKVAVLAHVNFWCGRDRNLLFRERPPAYFYPCSDRPSMPPGEPNVPRDQFGALIQPESSGGTMDYGWWVFIRGYGGPTITKLLELRESRLSKAKATCHPPSRRGYHRGASLPAVNKDRVSTLGCSVSAGRLGTA
jgi:hypothetical protein